MTRDIVAKYLKKMGVSANLKGYEYLRDAIVMVIKEDNYKNNVHKRLYTELAKYYDTTPSRIERSIRYAAEMSADRCDCDLMEQIFGFAISAEKGKATNTQFIFNVAEYIKEKERLCKR